MSITTWALAVMLTAACGANKKEVRRARTSGYDGDFALVYSAVLDAMRKHYPTLTEDASAGVIRTSWHPIKLSNVGTTDGQSTQQRDTARRNQRSNPGVQNGSLGGTNQARTRYFIRLDAHVLGGKPWRVRLTAQASKWELGAVPVELKGADEPHWLRGRVDSLYVEIYRRLESMAVPLKVTETLSKPKAAPDDLSHYGAIPNLAAVAVNKVAKAAAGRDLGALRAMMDDEFTWSLGGDTSAEQAVVMWQADTTALAALDKLLSGGCASDGEIAVVCPAAGKHEGYRGALARFELRGGHWFMTAFLRGE